MVLYARGILLPSVKLPLFAFFGLSGGLSVFQQGFGSGIVKKQNKAVFGSIFNKWQKLHIANSKKGKYIAFYNSTYHTNSLTSP